MISISTKILKKLLKITCPILPKSVYLKLRFKLQLGYPLNLDNPRTFNEKLQWLKLNDIHPEYTKMVDKDTAKDYVAGIIGEEYVIPTIGKWDIVDDIDWDSLPNQFVIKNTGDSGGVVVCKDKSKLDVEAAKAKLKKGLSLNYYRYNKEYPYKDVKSKVLAEAYMEDESGYELKDYKIFCSYGEPKFLFVATGRQNHDVRFDFFDLEFNHIPVTNDHSNADVCPTKPKNFEKMLEIAGKLSVGIPQVRVDLYNCNGKIYFGELTFFHFSGMHPFVPREWDYKFGEMINLPFEKK